MEDADIKLARLLETFDDIDISFVEELIEQQPNASLQDLINQCQKHRNNDTKNDKNDSNKIFAISSEAISMECDTVCIETLDNIQYEFHYLFDPYLSSKYIFKLIDIFHHLSIMREEYKCNNQNIDELNLCIKTISNFMNNIHSHPETEKYRRIRESNTKFQKKVGQIKGSMLLLKLCGWIYIEIDNDSNIYLFESNINPQFIQIIVKFLNEYMKHSKIQILPSNQTIIDHKNTKQKITEIAETKNDDNGNDDNDDNDDINTYKPMSKEDEIRYNRLKNFGDISRLSTKVSKSCKIGPKLDVDYKKSMRSESNEEKTNKLPPKQTFRKSKHFNMNDILKWRKIDFDREAAGTKIKSKMDEIGVKCLEFTNEFRIKQGLKRLKWHQALCEIGKEHSKNMGEKIVKMGHDGFHERVEKYPFHSVRAAENVAMNHCIAARKEDVARSAVDGWIKSPGHRKNLLGDFTHCGIGVYQNFDGAMYLTQLFAYTHYKVDGTEQVEEDESYLTWFHKATAERFKFN